MKRHEKIKIGARYFVIGYAVCEIVQVVKEVCKVVKENRKDNRQDYREDVVDTDYSELVQ